MSTDQRDDGRTRVASIDSLSRDRVICLAADTIRCSASRMVALVNR